jgi:hypothetical protein
MSVEKSFLIYSIQFLFNNYGQAIKGIMANEN